MAAAVSHKLRNAFEGALAGGGDPATSPLYVFTPFLKLIVVGAVAGVANVTFGGTVWLVVLTVFMVSLMYRFVMRWVTDGSGGSGLAEEEFGGWAVKTNAAITYIEYTLTFLVSMAALVTFIADRFPALNETLMGGLQYRSVLAVALSILTGWMVNRGPKATARYFGPATFGVLILLWVMVLSTLWHHLQDFMGNGGLLPGVPVFPTINLQAFSLQPTAPGEASYLHFTIGGYVRILAVMTGIEVFANLVVAYEGEPAEKSKKAFGSLIIIMGTTAVTMLIVGPAILALSDPANEHVSVFTQTMDALLPGPLTYVGTIVGIAVLLSASAASAAGIQNLSLGLATRRYIPPALGRPNRFGVAGMPVWLEVAVCCFCFLFIGTHEETYLAIYAAGVFILLSMTGWAATQRLIRELGRMRENWHASKVFALIASILAATLTSVATVIIFQERFFEGAWTFLLFIPLLYAGFTYVKDYMGVADPLSDRLGEIQEATLGGFGPGQVHAELPQPVRVIDLESPAPEPPSLETVGLGGVRVELDSLGFPQIPPWGEGWRSGSEEIRHVLAPLDGEAVAETALPLATRLSSSEGGRITLLSVLPESKLELDDKDSIPSRRAKYLQDLVEMMEADGRTAELLIRETDGPAAAEIIAGARAVDADVIVIASHGRSIPLQYLLGSVSRRVIHLADRPVVVVRPRPDDQPTRPPLKKVLVALDGSQFAERVLPYARGFAHDHGAALEFLVVPEIPEAEAYGPLNELVAQLREQSVARAELYLRGVLEPFVKDGINATGLVGGTAPARTITDEAKARGVGMIMLATHGRGGFDGLLLGSVAARVARHADCAVFMLPVHERADVVNGVGGSKGK